MSFERRGDLMVIALHTGSNDPGLASQCPCV